MRTPRVIVASTLAVAGLVGVSPSAPTATSAATEATADPCGTLAPVRPGTSHVETVDVDGTLRSYVLHVPGSYDPAEPTPVILAFHGRKSSGAEMESYSGLSRLDALVAYPDGMPDDEGKTGWAGAPYAPAADDVGFVRTLLDRLQRGYCVDADRVYATGKSNGGGFTALLACVMPQRIAAFAPVAGAYYPQSSAPCHGGPPVPMLEFHGTADPIMEYGGGTSHGEAFPSVTTWLRRWVDRNHCRSHAVETIGTDVARLAWTDCAAGAEVVHYRIEGGGHTWPGELVDSGPGSSTHTISASEVMWDFFLEHPLHP